MRSIEVITRYHGPTATKGARVVATATVNGRRKQATVAYDHAATDPHVKAARALGVLIWPDYDGEPYYLGTHSQAGNNYRLSMPSRVQIVHSRHPDMSCCVQVFLDGVEVEADVEDIDPGAGATRMDWDERIEDWEGVDTPFGRAVHQALLDSADSSLIR